MFYVQRQDPGEKYQNKSCAFFGPFDKDNKKKQKRNKKTRLWKIQIPKIGQAREILPLPHLLVRPAYVLWPLWIYCWPEVIELGVGKHFDPQSETNYGQNARGQSIFIYRSRSCEWVFMSYGGNRFLKFLYLFNFTTGQFYLLFLPSLPSAKITNWGLIRMSFTVSGCIGLRFSIRLFLRSL